MSFNRRYDSFWCYQQIYPIVKANQDVTADVVINRYTSVIVTKDVTAAGVSNMYLISSKQRCDMLFLSTDIPHE
jgi:hypothetical protein